MRKFIYIPFILMLAGTALFAGVGVKKYAGEFLAGGVGGRALGMGGAYAAIGEDVTSGYWNPAGLALIRYPEISAMHARRFGGVVNYDYLGVAMPVRKRASFGLSLVRLAVDDIPITAVPRPDLPLDATYTDEHGNVRANHTYVAWTTTDAEYAFYMSYAKLQPGKWAWGANLKIVHKGVAGHSAWGLGFDVGALWNPWKNLRLGANFQDVTTTLLAWDTGERELIAPTLKLGLAYPFTSKSLKSRLLIAADTDLRFEGRKTAAQSHYRDISADFHGGLEWMFHNVFALRVGSDMGYFSAGAGLRLPKLDLDYAFLKHDELENSHRISLRLRLEERKFARH